MLGNRSICWGGILLDGSFEVVEKTDGALKNDLKQGKKVLGIKLTADGNLELDKEKYFRMLWSIDMQVLGNLSIRQKI